MVDDAIVKVSKGHFKKLRELNRRRNYFFKKVKINIRIFIAKIIWDSRRRKTLKMDEVKNILLIRNEGTIGDQAVCYPLIKNLHNAGFVVDILLTKSSSCFMKHNPHLRKIYESDDLSTEGYLKSFNHAIPDSIVIELKNNKYDLVIDPSLDIPVHRLRLLNDINAKYVIGLNKWSIIKRYSVSLDFKDNKKHITESIKCLANRLGINYMNLKPYDIYIPIDILQEVSDFLYSHPKKTTIIINIFAGSKERCLSQEQLSTIINKLNTLYYNINIILLDHRSEIKIKLPSNVRINPFKTIYHMMALIHESDLIISPDTSVVHISAAWEKNLVSIYKDVDENTNLWAPGYHHACQIVVHTRSLQKHDGIPELILGEIARLNMLVNNKIPDIRDPAV